MNLKYLTFWLLLFLSLSTVASAQQLTKADLQGLENRVQGLEIKVSNLEIKVEEMDKRFTALMNILIGVILAAIALPQVLGYLQAKREREEFHKQLHDLRAETQQHIHDLRTEIQQQSQNLQTEIRDLRVEIRALGERLDHQQQMVFEKFIQQQQDIEELKSRLSVTPS